MSKHIISKMYYTSKRPFAAYLMVNGQEVRGILIENHSATIIFYDPPQELITAWNEKSGNVEPRSFNHKIKTLGSMINKLKSKRKHSGEDIFNEYTTHNPLVKWSNEEDNKYE